ncbi:hypothetical protein [Bacteroides sp.]|uniref:hypothetical protein n=1 Tax=Bacteroides sp. TaxID=29523 RepID=UPI003A90F7B2
MNQISLMSKNSQTPKRNMVADSNGRLHICLTFFPQVTPKSMEYIGLKIKNSIIHNAIPVHSDANFATANGRINITTAVMPSHINRSFPILVIIGSIL